MINQYHLCKVKWGKVTPLPCLHPLGPGFVRTFLWLLECRDKKCSQSRPSLSVFPTTGLSCDAIFFRLESWWTKHPYEGLQISQPQTAIVFHCNSPVLWAWWSTVPSSCFAVIWCLNTALRVSRQRPQSLFLHGPLTCFREGNSVLRPQYPQT